MVLAHKQCSLEKLYWSIVPVWIAYITKEGNKNQGIRLANLKSLNRVKVQILINTENIRKIVNLKYYEFLVLGRVRFFF